MCMSEACRASSRPCCDSPRQEPSGICIKSGRTLALCCLLWFRRLDLQQGTSLHITAHLRMHVVFKQQLLLAIGILRFEKCKQVLGIPRGKFRHSSSAADASCRAGMPL